MSSVDAPHAAPARDGAAGGTVVLAAQARPSRFSRVWWESLLPRPTLLAGLLLVATTLATPWIVRPVGWYVAVSVLALVLLDSVLTIAPWRLGVRRDAPDVLVLGGSGDVTYEVGTPRAQRLHVWLADELVPSFGAGTRRHALVVPGSGSALAATTCTPWRRGTFELGPVVVRVAGPLRLATRQATRVLPARTEVHPAFPSRDRTLLRLEQERLLTAGNRLTRSLGGGTEFDHLREYRYGDDVRRVDWGATARLGHPVVRRYRVERDRDVLILLDHGRSAATVVEGVPRLDHGMDAVMALQTAAAGIGDRAGVVVYAHDVTATVAPARRTDQVARTASLLHTLEPELVEADHRRAFAFAASRQRRRALLVVVTDLGAGAAVDALADALPVLTSRHEVVVASVRDPEVARVADHVPADALAAHHAAGAADVLARRDAAAVTLRTRGARVVEGPPQVVADRLVDAYLDLKSRGRI